MTGELGELVKSGDGKIHTGPFGSQLHASDYVEDGIPCIMPANMKNSRVDLTSISYISELDAKRLSKYLVKENDIIYSRRGDVTQKALIRQNEAGYFCGTGCLLLRPGSNFDARFLTYYLSTSEIQKWIVSQAVGATMPNLNTGILSRLPFNGPEKLEQSKIADVLSVIENKIELNNQINTELEAMAKTLYDYWFVQFDFPDADGKPYKSSGGKMVYSKVLKREIPEGWEVKPVSKIIEVRDGTHDSPKPSEKGEYLITSKHLQPSGIDFSNAYFISYEDFEAVNKRSKVDEGDFLISMIGTIGLSQWVMKITTPFAIKNIGLFKTSQSPEYADYIFASVTSSYGKAYLQQNQSTGTSQPYVTLGTLRGIPITIPSKNVFDDFNTKVKPTHKLLYENATENQKLVELRDWLLPMLMNGQVTVK